MIHLELCHINNCHYDVVTMFNGEPSPYPPPRPTTLSHIDLTQKLTSSSDSANKIHFAPPCMNSSPSLLLYCIQFKTHDYLYA